MTNKMQIKSNTKGKLNKIIKGFVFSDPYVFITEFFQNSYRAKSKVLSINYDQVEGTLSFLDDGSGLKKLEDILVLDYSSWESTEEGFGIGFWSWLAFDKSFDDESNEVECFISSGKYQLGISKSSLLSDGEPSADTFTELESPVKGFNVTLKSDLLKDKIIMEDITERIMNDGRLMMFDIYFNGCPIEKKNILDDVTGDCMMTFSNRLFEAKLAVGNSAGRLELYYEKRHVRTMYVSGRASGAIELNKKTLNLREPDRKDYVYDDKYYKFDDWVDKCVKELYINMMKTAHDDTVTRYADEIVSVLSVSDYEKLLNIDDVVLEIKSEERDVTEVKEDPLTVLKNYLHKTDNDAQLTLFASEETEEDSDNIKSILNSTEPGVKWVSTGEISENKDEWLKSTIEADELSEMSNVVIKGKIWTKISNESDYTQEPEEVRSTISVNKTSKSIKKANIVNVISKSRKKVWVKASEVESYENEIQKAKYYGIKVFIAKNIMYEKVFESRNVPHVAHIKDNVEKINISKNVGIKTSKEKKLLELLIPICKYYQLPENTFLIGELELRIETKLNDVVVDREYVKNSRDSFKVYAVTDGASIILDRRALNLKRFAFSDSIDLGKNEFKALMSILNTVSHELSHLLYDTTDNTIEHFQTQEKISEEIVALYNSLS